MRSGTPPDPPVPRRAPRTDRRDAPAPPQRRISLPFDIFALSTRLGTYLGRALEGTGVRPAEYAVYSLMLEAGPRTPSELAAMLGMPLSTLSTYLGSMLAARRRAADPEPVGRSLGAGRADRSRARRRADA